MAPMLGENVSGASTPYTTYSESSSSGGLNGETNGVNDGTTNGFSHTTAGASTPPVPIAIVGMACRLPGDISKPSDLWTLLEEKRTGYKDFDSSRFNIDAYYHPTGQRPGSINTRGGNLINTDVRLFDHTFFHLKPSETLTLDPLQRKLLEVTYEAFEASGEPWDAFAGSRTGVFVGSFGTDYVTSQMLDMDFALPYTATGASKTILSNRINHVFDLRGPSMTVDTACASSIYALHAAVSAIRNGECEAAIVAGCNLIQAPEMQQFVGVLGALSGSSTCHTFDKAADGYSRSEGICAVYLRRYDDAVQGRYPVRAVIRGTAVNSNGRTAGITHPSADGQEALIRQAYKSAQLSPGTTGYFECHGTGTPVGDPIEVAAVGRVFSSHQRDDARLLIGSVKTNLGHSESASSLTGVMKAVLCLEKAAIPASVGIENFNPSIDFEKSKVHVVTEMTPWPENRLKRASVNSFGYGGANGHCILDHPDLLDPESALHTSESKSRRLVLLPFSAHDDAALSANVDALQHSINELSLSDVAYTLSSRRTRFSNRTYAIVDSTSTIDIPSAIEPVSKTSANQTSRIGFVFTGQGAQWHAMGSALFEYAEFRDSIRAQDAIIASLSAVPKPGWTIEGILTGSSSESVQDPEISQTVCTALQVGLVDLLHTWNISPSGTIGHSSGEIAAAYAARQLSRAEAIVIAYCRGQSVIENKQSGAMLAVGMSHEDALAKLTEAENPRIKVAAINSPDSTTLSGDAAEVEALAARLTAEGAFARLLKTGGNAYHSHHMTAIGERYEEMLTSALSELHAIQSSEDYRKKVGEAESRHSKCRWVSSVTPFKAAAVRPAYWRQNLESPVRFSEAAEMLLTDTASNEQIDILIEIGPHSALQGPLKRITAIAAAGYGVRVPVYLSALKRFADGMRNLLELSGSLFALNHGVDLAAVNAADDVDCKGLVYGKVCVDMPTYCYSYGPMLYHEPRLAREKRQRATLCHDLLGVVGVGGAKDRPFWRNLLRHKDLPWLGHHRLLPNAVLPGAAYVCAAMEAARQYVSERNGLPENYCYHLRNVSIRAALTIPDDEFGVEMVTNLQVSSHSEDWLEFKISSVDKDGLKWTENASGTISIKASPNKTLRRLDERINARRVDTQNWYSEFERIGLGYGKAFQCLSEIQSDPYKHLASAKLQLQTTQEMFKGPESSYPIHPASLDACFQLAIIAIHGGQTGQMKHGFIPVSIDDLTVWPQAAQDFAQTICQTEMEGLRTACAQIQVLTPSGLPRVELSNLKAVSYYGGVERATAPDLHEYSRLVWKPDITALNSDQAARALTSSSTLKDAQRLEKFLQLVGLAGHNSPSMSVLEINGGAALTEAALSRLGGDIPNKSYASYTVTGHSTEKLDKAQNNLKAFKNVEYKIFNLAQDPASQGFTTQFDYVIASEMPFAQLVSSLKNIRSLLKVGGRLMLLREEDSALLSDEQRTELATNGFSTQIADGAILVATAIDQTPKPSSAPSPSETVYIVHDEEPSYLLPAIEQQIRSSGLSPSSLALSSAGTISENSRVIITLDLEAKGLFDISETSFYHFKDIMMRCSSILWLTKDSPVASETPAAALATGFIRTLPKERPEANFGIMHLDLKSQASNSDDLAGFIVRQEAKVAQGIAELEYAIHDGVGYIPRQLFDDALNKRFRAINTPSTEPVDVHLEEQEPAVVDFITPGLISSAHFKRDDTILGPLEDDYIEIKTAAIGLTEKDVGGDDGLTDVAGTVLKCGSTVTNFKPGDRVFSLARSRLATHVRVPASLAQPMGSDEVFSNMATVPSAFCSALYALVHVARVRKGDRVFVQSPTSSLGLAAIQIATSVGAEIFASVQTAHQEQYLKKDFAISEGNLITVSPNDQIDDVVARLVAATKGKGFNVILSNITDSLMSSIGRCIAPRGSFIHAGKLDAQHRRSVGLDVLDRNATFSSFDLYSLSTQDIAFCSELMEEVGAMLRNNTIRPLFSAHVHPISQLTQALHQLSKTEQIGKLVLDFGSSSETVKMIPSAPQAIFDPHAEYILVGGLGGLGMSVLQWWVLRGARHLTVWSRSGPSAPQAIKMVEDMRLAGVEMHVKKCDVTSREQVEEAMREASARHPVKGILNTAVTYADSFFVSLPYDQWKLGLSAKVQGSINLHEVSIEQKLKLDFFVMTSSIDGLLALPTTGAYCAANCFQDALARHRRLNGLPACAIGFGLITEVTEVATMEQVLANQRNNQLYQTDEFTFLHQVEAAFLPDPVADDSSRRFDPLATAQIMTGLEPSKLAGAYRAGESPMWRGESRVAHIARAMYDHLSASSDGQVEPSEEKATKVAAPVHAAIQAGKTQAAIDLVTTILVQRIAVLLMIPMESIVAMKSVAHYGVDSLVAVELRSWMLVTFEFAVPLLKLLDESVSIEELAGAVVENLSSKAA
ncbi:ketoacyl-synt-domain-containing protein [Byssothecium circinans]|uniref:Ketoacyl-synt-domain-containing protein n=1 Tax=Byssothecium circinans TaxID=147558 RepID=A0A6A5TCW1_9PLEO|nr:ketoacyl-synt-domain-containing protein [Byssothecium circinans]